MDSTRKYPRMSKLHLLTYVNREGDAQRTPVSMGRIVDISAAGAGIEVFEEIREGSRMEMELDLQDSLLSVAGTVVHVTPREDGKSVVGVQFDTPQPKLAEGGPAAS